MQLSMKHKAMLSSALVSRTKNELSWLDDDDFSAVMEAVFYTCMADRYLGNINKSTETIGDEFVVSLNAVVARLRTRSEGLGDATKNTKDGLTQAAGRIFDAAVEGKFDE